MNLTHLAREHGDKPARAARAPVTTSPSPSTENAAPSGRMAGSYSARRD